MGHDRVPVGLAHTIVLHHDLAAAEHVHVVLPVLREEALVHRQCGRCRQTVFDHERHGHGL